MSIGPASVVLAVAVLTAFVSVAAASVTADPFALRMYARSAGKDRSHNG